MKPSSSSGSQHSLIKISTSSRSSFSPVMSRMSQYLEHVSKFDFASPERTLCVVHCGLCYLKERAIAQLSESFQNFAFQICAGVALFSSNISAFKCTCIQPIIERYENVYQETRKCAPTLPASWCRSPFCHKASSTQ